MADNDDNPAPFTAEVLAQIFRRGGDVDVATAAGHFTFVSRWYQSMQNWTDDECRDVLEAAEHCKCVRGLHVEVSALTGRAAALVPLILRRLTCVETFGFGSSTGIRHGETQAVDTMLSGIAKSSSKIENLAIYKCVCDPQAFLEFCTRYRDSLREILIRTSCERCAEISAFASSVAMSWGLLASVRHVSLNLSKAFHPSIPCLLTTLHKAPTVETLDIVIPLELKPTLNDLAVLCCCTDSLERVRVHGLNPHMEDAVNMYSFFDVGFSRTFSATIKEIHFLKCAFRDNVEGTLLERAAIALHRVEFLRFGGCHFPSAFNLLERLPRLKGLAIVSQREYYGEFMNFVEDYEDEENVAESQRLLAVNEDLARLCQVIRRKESALEEIELELVGRGAGNNDDGSFVSFPAIDDLLRCCKGRLILDCVNLPWESYNHILGGFQSLSGKLNDLRLHFKDFQLADNDCAKIFRALCSNTTLASFEIGFGAQVTLASSATAIHDLVTSNSTLQVLSLRGLGSEAPTVLERITSALTDKNRTLRVLKLHNADMANRWPEILGPMKAMLEVNHVFSAIGGCELPSDDPIASDVRKLLKLNWYGRMFWKAEDLPSKMIWANVLERISNDKDHQVMFKFLRAKPAGERLRVGLKRVRPVDDLASA